MYPGSTIVSGCGVCEKLCVELTFSEPREFMSWAMMNGFALEKDSFLTEVYFDAPKGRAGTTTILKCTKCGQHFSTTVGKAGPLIPWKPLDQPPVSDPNAVAVAATYWVTTPMTAPNRRWPRFGLRTLFAMVTVCAGWLAWDVKLVRDRTAMRQEIEQESSARMSVVRGLGVPVSFVDCWKVDVLSHGRPEPVRIGWIRQLLGDEQGPYLIKRSNRGERPRIDAAFSRVGSLALPRAGERGPAAIPRDYDYGPGELAAAGLGPACTR